MFKLPVCPYCGKKVRYTHTIRLMGEKTHTCRTCGKISKVRFKGKCAVTAGIMAFFAVLLNTLMLFSENNKTLLPNLAVTLIFIVLYFVLSPLNVRLFEVEGQRDPEPKRKKNRRRHKKTKYTDPKFDENPLAGTSFEE